MSRETLKSAVVAGLRARRLRLLRAAAMVTQPLDDMLRVTEKEPSVPVEYIELAMVAALIDRLESTEYDPFLDYHVQYADGRTVYMIGDSEIEIIESDVDGFVLRAVRAMYDRLAWCAHDVLKPDTVNNELVTIIDKIFHGRCKKM